MYFTLCVVCIDYIHGCVCMAKRIQNLGKVSIRLFHVLENTSPFYLFVQVTRYMLAHTAIYIPLDGLLS